MNSPRIARKLARALALAIPMTMAATAVPAMAQTATKSERVSFRPGTTSTTITRTIRGWETIDFVVSASEGQRLTASMVTVGKAAYFNIIMPGERDAAFYVGNAYPANRYSGPVPRSGDLKFRVYLNRADARRGARTVIRLSISITGTGGVVTQLPGQGGSATQLPGQGGTATQLPGQGGSATQLPADNLIPGTSYHARGTIDCTTVQYGPRVKCQFGVRRFGQGSAVVTVTKPDGRTRTITFERGVAVGYDQSEAERAPMSAGRHGDVTIVNIGPESFEFVDAIMFGG